MIDRSTLPLVVLALLVGTVVGPVAGPLLTDAAASDPGPDPASPPASLSSGGADCLAEEVRPNGGWVHEVAVGRAYAVTLNATVEHDRGETVTANVSRVAPGSYVVDLRTVPGDPDAPTAPAVRTTPAGDCPVGTTVDFAVSLPTEYDRLEVAVSGRTVRTVENEDTVADLYRLPNPVNATA